MVIPIVLVILWTSWVAMRLLLRADAQHARTLTTAHPHQACAEPRRAQTDAGSQDGPAWSALDDRQLTRLLTDSAPRTITE
jgi:hypothetical protein